MSKKQWFMLLMTAALFGSSFLFINIGVKEIPPLSFAALRVGVAGVFMVLVLFLTGNKLPVLGRAWWPLLVLGLLTAAIPYFAIAWGQTRISSNLGGILFATIPIFTIIVAPFVIEEGKLTPAKVIGVFIGFIGVIIAVGPSALENVSGQLTGTAMTLLAALSYAIGNIYARLRNNISPIVMATGQLLTGTLILVPLSFIFDEPVNFDLSSVVIVSVFATALASTALPVLLMFWLVKNVGATNTSNLAFFIPIAAVFLGTFVLGEAIAPITIAGFVLTLLGALLATGSLKNLLMRLGIESFPKGG